MSPDTSTEADKVERLLLNASFSLVEIQSFTKYADLPIELKIKIWEFAIPHLPGRIIPVMATKLTDGPARYSCALPHQILFYNDAALRHVLLRDYQLFPPGSGHAIITTKLDKDTLLFSERSTQPTISLFQDSITEEKAKDMKRVAIEYDVKPHQTNIGRTGYSGNFRDWPRTRNVYLVEDLLEHCFQNLEVVFFLPVWDLKIVGCHLHKAELSFAPTRGPLHVNGTYYVDSARREYESHLELCLGPPNLPRIEFVELDR